MTKQKQKQQQQQMLQWKQKEQLKSFGFLQEVCESVWAEPETANAINNF